MRAACPAATSLPGAPRLHQPRQPIIAPGLRTRQRCHQIDRVGVARPCVGVVLRRGAPAGPAGPLAAAAVSTSFARPAREAGSRSHAPRIEGVYCVINRSPRTGAWIAGMYPGERNRHDLYHRTCRHRDYVWSVDVFHRGSWSRGGSATARATCLARAHAPNCTAWSGQRSPTIQQAVGTSELASGTITP